MEHTFDVSSFFSSNQIEYKSKITPKNPNSSPPNGKKVSRLPAPTSDSTAVRMKVPQAAHPMPKIPATRPPKPVPLTPRSEARLVLFFRI